MKRGDSIEEGSKSKSSWPRGSLKEKKKVMKSKREVKRKVKAEKKRPRSSLR